MSGITYGDVGNVLGDSSQLQITTVKFDGSNYLTWFISTLVYIKGENKEDYLIGDLEVSTPGDPKFQYIED